MQEFSPEEAAVLTRWIRPGDVVVHAGDLSSPWAVVMRARHPGARLVEISGDEAVDEAKRRHGLRHINHLVIQRAQDFAKTVAGAARTIAHARADVIHFKPGIDGRLDIPSMQQLAAQGYRFFRLAGGGLEPLMLGAPVPTGPCVAIQERLLFGPEATELDFPALCARHGIAVRGVLHVGAHEGQELGVYEKLGAQHVLFIEANPKVFARLAAAMAGKAHVTCVNRAVCERHGKVDLHVTSFDQSSSLLPLQRHLEVYPQIVADGIVSVDGAPLDALLEELGLGASRFNLLAIDVQGAEALVLKGASATLSHIDAIGIEVNFTDLYRGAAEIEDIEALLVPAGFRRVCLISAYHPSWGDAFYVRERGAGAGEGNRTLV